MFGWGFLKGFFRVCVCVCVRACACVLRSLYISHMT